ncbi:hypothetical protein BaRGS_00015673 [Batillaria attramentaria]|uniref:Uncharacterized protein n=1 Tax=Batillaria attramentaria TaxID=370345 RepID=A0ABD0L260_9CAEN
MTYGSYRSTHQLLLQSTARISIPFPLDFLTETVVACLQEESERNKVITICCPFEEQNKTGNVVGGLYSNCKTRLINPRTMLRHRRLIMVYDAFRYCHENRQSVKMKMFTDDTKWKLQPRNLISDHEGQSSFCLISRLRSSPCGNQSFLMFS